jgi:TonB-dependent starch-binding outer membrane protein SusC
MKKSFTNRWKVVKMCATQAMIAMIICGVSAAHDNYAQLLDKKVTLSLKEVPLEVALKEIELVTNVKIFYSIDQLEIKEVVSIEAKNETLRSVLHDLLGPFNIKYKVNEKKAAIILKRYSEPTESDETALFNRSQSTMKQQRATITGTVVDVSEQPMAGVNIVVKGTVEGTTTDPDGHYSLQAESDDVLVFSFIGYVTFETKVNGRRVIDVVLQEDVRSLKEVTINAGYYMTTKATQTGNISKVTAEEIQRQPVQNPLAALQGRVPGLEVTQNTGVPGGNFTVRIRGTNSIANGNDPLFIIDGVPYISGTMAMPETSGLIAGPGGFSPFSNINPSDIESIEVLKDADATAIYGSRGANGVILITTKKGVQGKTKVDFNFYSGGGKVASKMDLLSSQQYLAMRREAFQNDNITPTLANARDLVVWDTTRYTDWQKKLIGGTARITDAQISVSGGTSDTQFLIGTGYHKETTVFPGNNSDTRGSINTNLVHTAFNQKLNINFSLNYAVNNSNLLYRDLTRNAMTLPPIAPQVYDEQGNLSWEFWTSAYENPLANTRRFFESRSANFIGNTVVQYKVLDNLILKSSVGYTSNTNKAITTNPISSQAPDIVADNITFFSNSTFHNWIVEPQLNWNPTMNLTRFNVIVGATFLSQLNEGLAQLGRGFSSEALMKNLSAAATVEQGTEFYAQYRYHAIFGRINYARNDKYFINLTGRRDGSSRFGPGKQFSIFGALGAAWIFSEEDFIKNNLAFLAFGKIRASYGITGNDQLGDYNFLDTYSSSGGQYQGSIGLRPDRLSNPDFAWETNKKTEIGIEFGFLNDRISTTLSAYRNRSSNQLVGYPLPGTTGFTSIQGNFPATIQNQGVEMDIITHPVQSNAFRWTTSVNISIPRNKLVSFPDLEAFPAYSNLYVVGEPLSIRKVYKYTGMDDQGLYTFQDVNEDGVYNTSDRQTVANVGRDYFGGLSNTLYYKCVELNILFQFVKQSGNNSMIYFASPGSLTNQPVWVMDRWQDPSDLSEFQRFGQTSSTATPYNRLINSNRAVGDASFIRLKNISLAYTIPEVWIRKTGLSMAKIFINGQNLLTFTKYKGLDPETQFGTVLPPLRVLSGGINITF